MCMSEVEVEGVNLSVAEDRRKEIPDQGGVYDHCTYKDGLINGRLSDNQKPEEERE